MYVSEYVRIPKYIQKELSAASDCVNKMNKYISDFEDWVRNNIDENFDFDLLRASSSEISPYGEDSKFQTEALTEVEYGNEVDIDALERTLNYFKSKTE